MGWLRPIRGRVPHPDALFISGGKIFKSGIYAHAPARHVYQINDTWAITLGGSYSEDEKIAEENLVQYNEVELTAANLFAFNQATGALDENGVPTGNEIIRFKGIPYSRSFHRAMYREFEESNYRVNIDYSPTDNALWYLSVTTGHRAGGFNLGYFSAFPSYDSEEVTSYELGH